MVLLDGLLVPAHHDEGRLFKERAAAWHVVAHDEAAPARALRVLGGHCGVADRALEASRQEHKLQCER